MVIQNSNAPTATTSVGAWENQFPVMSHKDTAGRNNKKSGELASLAVQADAAPDFPGIIPPGFSLNTDLDSRFEATPHDQILDNLLDCITTVDFVDAAELPEGSKLTRKHYLVIVIRKILELARARSWDICRDFDFVYLYNGAFWQEVDKELLQEFLGKAAAKMGMEKHDAEYYQTRKALFEQFMAVGKIQKMKPTAGTKINLLNGTFEIQGQRQALRTPRQEDFMKYQLPFAYTPTATAPRFHAYLDRVLPDKTCQAVIAEFLGSIFINRSVLKLEKTLLLYGSGANGKSVLFEIVNALLGSQNVGNYCLQSLTNENGYYRAALANKLVNWASEINGKLEASMFKALVSGEPVEARLPYGQPFTLNDYARLVFNTNELPRDVEHTTAFFRRFLIVPFTVSIPEAEQDRRLPQTIIETELSGVFNWILDGLKRLLANGNLTHSPAIYEQVERYRVQSDNIKMFLAENAYLPSVAHWKLAGDLYTEYRQFCSEDGYNPTGKKNFFDRVRNAGIVFERKKNGMVVFVEKGNAVSVESVTV